MTDDAIERLRQEIASRSASLRAAVPADRPTATVAVVGAIDRRFDPMGTLSEPIPDPVSGRHFACYGGKLAIRYCLEALDEAAPSRSSTPATAPSTWADQFLDDCDELARAETVLQHVEGGFMRLEERDDGVLVAWRATKRTPAAWRERAHIDWWANSLRASTGIEQPARPGGDPLTPLAYQFTYPPDAVIDGCSVEFHRDVLRAVIDRVQRHDNLPETGIGWSEVALVAEIASELDREPAMVERALAAFTVDRASAAWHATVPGVASAPLVRVAPDRLVASRLGLTTEPLFFLGRELRRRAAQEYHNSAWLREVTFRDDLRRVFADRRFVCSQGGIELRRGKGDVRTDIDAAVFDRKTGTLGLFELKSQDPFSRSVEEMERRRDNVLYANRQVSGVLDWLNRNSADEILRRLDERTARTFRVQKVYPFVLARYLVRFDDGAAPDRRAAWGTWPGVLHAVDPSTEYVPGANPIATLFSRLQSERIAGPVVPADARRDIQLGPHQVVVYGSHDAVRAR